MTDEPLDQRWTQLLIAARAWRANLIPKTSTTAANAANQLLRAIEAFDDELLRREQ
jgi:hypothetical protein